MSSAYETLLRSIREQNRARELAYEGRYHSDGEAIALKLAHRWRVALLAEPIDWSEMSAIREELRSTKMVGDISLFTFANKVEADFLSLRKTELSGL